MKRLAEHATHGWGTFLFFVGLNCCFFFFFFIPLLRWLIPELISELNLPQLSHPQLDFHADHSAVRLLGARTLQSNPQQERRLRQVAARHEMLPRRPPQLYEVKETSKTAHECPEASDLPSDLAF